MPAVIDFYRRQGLHFSTSKKMLLKQLASVEAIRESRTEKRVNRTPDKRIGGENQRYIWLKKEALDKLNSHDGT